MTPEPASDKRSRVSTACMPGGRYAVYQAVEKRDLLCCASSFVSAAYGMYASFLSICAPCSSSFFISLLTILCINGCYGMVDIMRVNTP